MALLDREEEDFMTIKGGTMSREDEEALASILDSVADRLRKIESVTDALAKATNEDEELARATLVGNSELVDLRHTEIATRMKGSLPYIPREPLESIRTMAATIADLARSRAQVSTTYQEIEKPAVDLIDEINHLIGTAIQLPATGNIQNKQRTIDQTSRRIINTIKTELAKSPDTAARFKKNADGIVDKLKTIEEETKKLQEIMSRSDTSATKAVQSTESWSGTTIRNLNAIGNDIDQILLLNKDEIPKNLAVTIAGFVTETRKRTEKIPTIIQGIHPEIPGMIRQALNSLEAKTRLANSPAMVTIKTQVTDATKQGESIIKRLDTVLKGAPTAQPENVQRKELIGIGGGLIEAIKDLENAKKAEGTILGGIKRESELISTDLSSQKSAEETMFPSILEELRYAVEFSKVARQEIWQTEPTVKKIIADLERYRDTGIDIERVRQDFQTKSWISRLMGQKDEMREIIAASKRQQESIRKNYKKMTDLYATLNKTGGDDARRADSIYAPVAQLWKDLDSLVTFRQAKIKELQTALMELPDETVRSTYSSIKDIVGHIKSIEEKKDHPLALAYAMEDIKKFLESHKRLVETVNKVEKILNQIRPLDFTGQLERLKERITTIQTETKNRTAAKIV